MHEKELQAMMDTLELMETTLRGLDPAELIIPNETGEAIFQDILQNIPDQVRPILPEDDKLAVIVYMSLNQAQ